MHDLYTGNTTSSAQYIKYGTEERFAFQCPMMSSDRVKLALTVHKGISGRCKSISGRVIQGGKVIPYVPSEISKLRNFHQGLFQSLNQQKLHIRLMALDCGAASFVAQINQGLDRKPLTSLSQSALGCGSPVVKVSNHGRHVMSSIQVPLKTRRVGQRCTLNLSRAETSSRWCGVVVRRGGASSGVVHVT
ncbi:uncharacterized protein TNCV_831061 [Trichonephila clavipes]|nr:uncharacterized protein TNCV_831061 [Trichonephila clavipes]